jgi:predicted Zn-dependent protease
MSRRLVVSVVAAVSVLASCSGGEVNRGDINLFGIDTEWELGDELALEVVQQVELLDDPVVQAYVEEIGRDLVAQTELADREWTFSVVRDPTINAFAVPGGHIFVHTGLLRAVETEAELAGALAHEASHVEARHGTELLTRAYGINTLLDLLGDEEGDLERIAEDLVGGGAVAKFSRDAEREADALGIVHLASAGYRPEGIAGFFEALLEQQDRRAGVVDQFFASHPLTDERLRRALELSQDLEPSPPLEATDGTELAEIQQRLAAVD